MKEVITMTNTVKTWANNYTTIALNEGTAEALNGMTTEEKATKYVEKVFYSLCIKLNKPWYIVFGMSNFETLIANELGCNRRQFNNKVFNTWYSKTANEI